MVGDLSIAHRRMVVIARGLAQQARMVVLDEPTASLSDEEIRHLFAVIRRLRATGIGVLYVSHRLDEIFDLTERVVVMRNAQVVADEPTRSSTVVVDRPHHRSRGCRHGDRAPPRPRIGGRPTPRWCCRCAAWRPTRLSAVLVRVPSRRDPRHRRAGRRRAHRAVRAVFGADRRTGGTIAVHGKVVDVRNPEAAMAAGMALLPEDRKSQGNVMDFSVRHNITLASLREPSASPRICRSRRPIRAVAVGRPGRPAVASARRATGRRCACSPAATSRRW